MILRQKTDGTTDHIMTKEEFRERYEKDPAFAKEADKQYGAVQMQEVIEDTAKELGITVEKSAALYAYAEKLTGKFPKMKQARLMGKVFDYFNIKPLAKKP